MSSPVPLVAEARDELDDLADRLLAGEPVGLEFTEAHRHLRSALSYARRGGSFTRLCVDIVSRPRWGR